MRLLLIFIVAVMVFIGSSEASTDITTKSVSYDHVPAFVGGCLYKRSCVVTYHHYNNQAWRNGWFIRKR